METAEISALIHDFVLKNIDVQGAILTNHQGVSIVFAFSDKLNISNEKAIIDSFFSLIKEIKKNLILGIVERIIIEGNEGYCILIGCKRDLILLVLANKDVTKGWLFLEIRQLIKKMNNKL